MGDGEGRVGVVGNREAELVTGERRMGRAGGADSLTVDPVSEVGDLSIDVDCNGGMDDGGSNLETACGFRKMLGAVTAEVTLISLPDRVRTIAVE